MWSSLPWVPGMYQHVTPSGPKAGPWERLAISAKLKLFLPLRNQEGSGFLDHCSPGFISMANTCRMALTGTWKRKPIRLGRGCGEGLRHGVLDFSFCNCPLLTSKVGQVGPPSRGLSFPTCEMGIRILAYLPMTVL